MNKIHPNKLLNSKWTAVSPVNKEKHFIVTKVEYDDDTRLVVSTIIEAVMTKKIAEIDWRKLNDSSSWLMGWK